MTRYAIAAIGLALTASLHAACGDSATLQASPRERVRARIDALTPTANIGHRGVGVNTAGNPFPENSLPSFREAIALGANGIELDVELTADGRLVVMHDDSLNRTTTCTGCVSAYSFADVRTCHLLDGDGVPTDEIPPTLAETFAVLPSDALVNVELKVYDGACRTPETGPTRLARTAIAEIRGLGVADRTLFSSFDEEAVATVRTEGPLYSALLLGVTESIAWPEGLAVARTLDQDALNPFFIVPAEGVRATLDAGLQANLWTVDLASDMEAAIDAGASAIITDRPGVLAGVIAARKNAR